MRVVRTGVALQCAGVSLALVVLLTFVSRYPQQWSTQTANNSSCGSQQSPAEGEVPRPGVPILSLLLLIACGVLEAIGALISAVSVKKALSYP